MNNGPRAQARQARLFDVPLSYERGRTKDSKERYLIQLLKIGRRDRTSLKHKIKKIESHRIKSEKRKDILRLDVAYLKKEIKTISTKNETELNALYDEIQRLRKLKQVLNERTKKASVERINETPIIDIGLYQGASVASAPKIGNKRRELDYRQKYATIRYVATTDAGNIPNEHETNRITLHSSVQGSSSSIFQIPQTEPFYNKLIHDAAWTFVDIFCKLEPRVLRTLWERYLRTIEGDKGGFLCTANMPVFLDNLILYIFRQENPNYPFPSRWKTKPLVSFLEFKLDPYIGKTKYITFEHFMQFPQWLKGTALKSQISVNPLKKALEYMSSTEEALRRRLQLGSTCIIWSEGEKKWCEGEVIGTKRDSLGEWLVVRYFANNFIIEKEVQRFSTLLSISPQVRKGTNTDPKDYQEKFLFGYSTFQY